MGLTVYGTRPRLVAAVVAIGIALAPAASASADHVDQSCAADTGYLRASYTSAQSFTPTVGTITRWRARIGVIDTFAGTLRSRLVAYPSGDTSVGFAGPGIVLGESSTSIARMRGGYRWIEFGLATPVDLLPLPPKAAFAIEIDFPTDASFQPYGGHIGWAICGVRYADGNTWQGVNPESLNRAGVSPVGDVPEPLTHLPLARQVEPVAESFEFQVLGQ
jgi:hypothetical protein